MPTAPDLHRCHICFKYCKRREHLQRHYSFHGIDRPHRCTSCNGAFQRADVLKRHIRTCGGKVSRSYACSTRRQACDRCVRQKKACSSGQPWQNCQRKAVPCNYSFHSSGERHKNAAPAQNGALILSEIDSAISINPEDREFEDFRASAFSDISYSDLFDPSGLSWLDFSDLMSQTQPLGVPCLPYTRNRGYYFHFLNNFTSRTGFVSSFDCGTSTQRRQVVSAFAEAAREPVTEQTVSSNIPVSPQVLDEQLVLAASNMNAATPLGDILVARPSWLYDPLVVKLQRIILLVKEVVTVKPRNSAVTLPWSTALEQKCLQFFSPVNVRKFLSCIGQCGTRT